MWKRLIDVAVSACGLVALAPVMAVIAAAVALESGFPVFFGHERVGKDFRRFRLWKFRSMVMNHGGPGITVGGDRRVTRVGRVLRAAKLDELPQLWNVLKGEMSLVGPRPEVAEYVERYRERFAEVLRVRPGITDLASVRYRNEEAVLAASADPLRTYEEEILPEKLALAEEYVRRRSLGLDMKILARTVWAVAAGCTTWERHGQAAGG